MNLNGHSPEAKAANKMIDDLIFVLKYYKRLNPTCLIVIEVPRAIFIKQNMPRYLRRKARTS